MTSSHRLVTFAVLLIACGGKPNDPRSRVESLQTIPCAQTQDCAARGGFCMNGSCHATNECQTNAQCTAGQTCVPDMQFGGLCAAAAQPPVPLPAWSCSQGKDCPFGQGCADDGKCHSDGECHADSECAADQLCYPGSSGKSDGFCSGARSSVDPYCRADGTGACRSKCTVDDDCGTFNHCQSGFCHFGDECQSDADCGPNDSCVPRFEGAYGISECDAQSMPTCVARPDGSCRLACKKDADCHDGGGCGADGYCHASNECASDADCPAGGVCYSSPEFGGLCGPNR
jgi:Cys-rich repeat protein